MKRNMLVTVGLSVFLVLPAFVSLSTETDSRLQVKTYNGIPYVSGGIGVDERTALETMGKEDSLELSFTQQNKQYLGGAEVLIKDDKGKTVLEAASDGPLFFAQLPAGKYAVEATAMGQTLDRVARVSSKGQAQLYFAWKQTKPQAQTHISPKEER